MDNEELLKIVNELKEQIEELKAAAKKEPEEPEKKAAVAEDPSKELSMLEKLVNRLAPVKEEPVKKEEEQKKEEPEEEKVEEEKEEEEMSEEDKKALEKVPEEFRAFVEFSSKSSNKSIGDYLADNEQFTRGVPAGANVEASAATAIDEADQKTLDYLKKNGGI